jgi:iron(III) transport system substrate-binding protein
MTQCIRSRLRVTAAAVVLLAAPLTAHAQMPEGYPADYANIVAAAEAEGSVVI